MKARNRSQTLFPIDRSIDRSPAVAVLVSTFSFRLLSNKIFVYVVIGTILLQVLMVQVFAMSEKFGEALKVGRPVTAFHTKPCRSLTNPVSPHTHSNPRGIRADLAVPCLPKPLLFVSPKSFGC